MKKSFITSVVVKVLFCVVVLYHSKLGKYLQIKHRNRKDK